MFRKKAVRLLFGTGTPVRIQYEDGRERIILDKEVRTDQILKLLAPIAGAQDTRMLDDGMSEYSYDSPAGAVRLRATTRKDRMTAEIIPGDAKFDGESEYDAPETGSVMIGSEDEEPPQTTPEWAPLLGDAGGTPDLAQAAAAIAAAPAGAGFEVNQLASGAPAMIEAPAGSPEIDTVLRTLVENGGSDLHLTSGLVPFIRRDGDITPLPGWDRAELRGEEIERWMEEVATERAKTQFSEEFDADFAYEIDGVARFRMNWFKDRNGTGAVMRTIPSKVLTAEQLGLPQVIRDLCMVPKGLVVVTGPTGSGKSTTLAGMVDLINKTRNDHIITIEDPVEFVHQSIKCLVNQREVHSHTMSFAAALRAALREDPDIVLVGELRDLETVHIAIETAETGHLVFGTLHTNTAASTVDRIIDQFPTDQQSQIRVMLSESLQGVVAQTLCKKKGGGRVACLEILVVNNAISNLIREGKTFQIPSMMQTGKGVGMQTQQDAMMALVREGTVAPAEAYRKAADQVAMQSALERGGFKIDDEG